MSQEHTTAPSRPGQPFSSLGKNFWIALIVLMTAAQMTAVFRWGIHQPGPAFVVVGDLLFNLLCFYLVLQASRRSTNLPRYFWYVAAFSVALFCVAALSNIYVQTLNRSQLVADIADIISVFWFCPTSLTLFLEPDFEPRRFDPIHILDFIQVVLLWVVIYFFFLYMPSHESSGSPYERTWVHATWVGSLMYDAAMAAIFLLRAAFTNSRVVRTLFGRIGVFLVLACLGDFYYNYLGGTLQAGSWYEVIWTFLNLCPIFIAATWDQSKIENTNVRPLFNELVGNRLFPILFAFIVLVLSLYIARERTLSALLIVGISFLCSSLRLLIAQQRQDRVQLELHAEILHRERVEQLLRQNEEHLEELVAERTVNLEESRHQLRQAQKMEAVGRLAGGIAHDFNNLLTVIRGYSRLLLDRASSSHEFRGGLERIDDAADRAASLTSQLLAFSRRQVLQPKVFNLNALVQNLEKMLRRLIGEDIEMRTVLAANVGSVRADRSQIEQVIMNLVVNARDAMPRGGKLTVETSNVYLDEEYARTHQTVQPGNYVLLAVSDTGAGIAPENLPRIFEPFFTTKELGKGTGLGLSMVYGIIKQSGGNIWVYSEPGRGTSFKIYLPLVNAPVEQPSAEHHVSSSRGVETILLAEDDDQVRELASEALSASGYSVLVAETPQAAISICRAHSGQIDLLLTDVVMPGIGGRDLATQVTLIRPDLRVLYMSGYTPQAILHHGELDADTFFIQKPFTPSSLAAKVREVLDHAAVPQPGPAAES